MHDTKRVQLIANKGTQKDGKAKSWRERWFKVIDGKVVSSISLLATFYALFFDDIKELALPKVAMTIFFLTQRANC